MESCSGVPRMLWRGNRAILYETVTNAAILKNFPGPGIRTIEYNGTYGTFVMVRIVL